MDELRIVLAGGGPLLQAGIVAALAAEDRFQLIAQVDGVQEAIDVLRRLPCDVLLLNSDTPRLDATTLREGRWGDAEQAKVLILTDEDDRHELLGALLAGVHGYGIRRRLLPEEIRTGVAIVGEGEHWMCRLAIGQLVQLTFDGTAEEAVRNGQGRANGPLSPREAEVLRRAAEGEGEDQIAEGLNVSRNTVKTYLRRIREKLQVTSRVEAVRYGLEHGLLSNRGPARHTGIA
jgi:DNA-binding NarL/FixJ family response regulator